MLQCVDYLKNIFYLFNLDKIIEKYNMYKVFDVSVVKYKINLLECIRQLLFPILRGSMTGTFPNVP